MTTDKICSQIMEICKNDKKAYQKYQTNLYRLSKALKEIEKPENQEVTMVIQTHRELSQIKNTKARFIEDLLGDQVFLFMFLSFSWFDEMEEEEADEIIEPGEVTLQEGYNSDAPLQLQISSLLLNYCMELLASKKDKSKRYKKRIKNTLNLLKEINIIFDIEGVKQLFLDKIEDKDKDVQFAAADGLAGYYASENAEEMPKEEIDKLEKIIETTLDRSTASTCCQALINADIIDEFGALNRIDNWKEKNYYS